MKRFNLAHPTALMVKRSPCGYDAAFAMLFLEPSIPL